MAVEGREDGDKNIANARGEKSETARGTPARGEAADMVFRPFCGRGRPANKKKSLSRGALLTWANDRLGG